MSRVLSLALKITGDASGVRLNPVERALKRLGEETDKVGKVFEKFASESEAGARAQADFARNSEALSKSLKAGEISAKQYAEEFAKLAEAANKEAAALERAARITEANQTNFERFTRTQRDLRQQVDAGRISQETYNRAVENAAKGLTAAERAAAGLGAAQKQIEGSAASTTLKFNELSGILAVLPGPLGNIAGRISGLASAGEGLGRIFQGGLRQGISGLGASVAALVNPFTVAIAGIAGFGAAASSIVSGLTSLEDRVERLGNLASQLGVSFEFVQVLEEAGRRTGVSLESVASSMTRLQRTLAGADEESKQATASLARLGISVEQLDGLTQQQQIELIGKQIASIEDPAKRTAAAVALFGRSGTQLLPFFRELPGAANDLERFGGAISEDDKARIDSLGLSFDSLGVALRALGQNILAPFAGLVAGVTDAIANTIGAVSNALGRALQTIQPFLDSIGQSFSAWGQGVLDATGPIQSALESIGEVFGRIFGFINTVVQAAAPGITATFDALVGAATRLAEVFSGTFQVVFDTLDEVFAAFGRLLGFDDVTSFATGLGEAFNVVYSAIAQVVTVVGQFIEIGTRIATVVAVAVGKLVAGAFDLVSQFLQFTGLGSAIQGIGNIIGRVFGSIASVFGTIASAIGGTVGRLLGLAEKFLGIQRTATQATEATQQIAEATKEVTDQTEVQVELSQKLAVEAERRKKEEKERADAVQKIVDANLEAIRIEQQFGGDSGRFRAAQNLLKINEEIARVEEQLRAARDSGDRQTSDALTARLATLDQVAKREEDIASGARKQREEAAKEAERAAKEAERLAERRRKAEERINKQIAETQQKFEERRFEIEKERAEEIGNIRSGSVKINDLRSGGISAFFDALKEDPAVAEAKKQTKELEQIRKGIAKLEAERVDILAGTG